jgi:predicted aconitase with swiveling domain
MKMQDDIARRWTGIVLKIDREIVLYGEPDSKTGGVAAHPRNREGEYVGLKAVARKRV